MLNKIGQSNSVDQHLMNTYQLMCKMFEIEKICKRKHIKSQKENLVDAIRPLRDINKANSFASVKITFLVVIDNIS